MSTSVESLRSRVETQLGDLTPTGRRVALILVDEHDRLGFHSATDIARMAATTDATVIRAVQQLGYSGIIELKADIARRLVPPTPAQRLDQSIPDGTAGDGDPLHDLLDGQLRALARLNQPDIRASIAQGIQAIAEAKRVFVNARGISVGIAAHAAAQLARIGIDARTLGDAAGITADDLLAIRDDDVIVVISTGLQRRWHDAMYERCAETGARTILITDTHPAPHPDAVVIRAGRGDPTGTSTHVATIATIETIILGLAAHDRQHTTATLDELNRHRERLTR